MEVPVFDIQGKQTGTMSVDEVALGETINADLIKQAFVMYHANLRQGSARTKNRAEIAFTRKKLYKQKGTGNARHGDKKVAQFRKGGHAKQKTRVREDYRKDMPVKMRRKANRNALLAKLIDQEVKVISGLTVSDPKTRVFVDMLKGLGVDKSALLALSPDGEKSKAARLSARNIESVELCRADQLTAFNMLNNRYLIIDQADLEAWLSGPSSQTDKSAKTDPMGRVKQEVA
ncbi:MAG: 50S ribosomal protein L4 [Phycisphaerales bacterium]